MHIKLLYKVYNTYMFSQPIQNLEELGIAEGQKVADIGSGIGYYAIPVAKKVGASGKVYAVEVQKDLIAKLKSSAAQEGVHNIDIIWGNAEKIGGTTIHDSTMDRVIVSNVLFQIEANDRDNLCIEMKRITKPGGKLLLIDWSENSPLGAQSFVPKPLAEALFTKAGFVVEKTFEAGNHHYGIVFKRV